MEHRIDWARFVERVEYTLRTRKLSERAWSLKAGLAPTTLNWTLRAIRGTGTCDMRLETVYVLAMVAPISPGWLAFDIGSPEDEASATAPPFTPNLYAAMGYMRGRGLLIEEAAAAVTAMARLLPRDLDETTWLAILSDLGRATPVKTRANEKKVRGK